MITCVKVLVGPHADGAHDGYVVQDSGIIKPCVDPTCLSRTLCSGDSWVAHCREIGVEYVPTLTFATMADLRRAVLSDYSTATTLAMPLDLLSGVAAPGAPFLERREAPAAGWGLFTSMALPANFLIGEYAGLWVIDGADTPSVTEEDCGDAARDGYRVCYPALDSLSGRHIGISALRMGNHMRLVNHAPLPPAVPAPLRTYANTRFTVIQGGGGSGVAGCLPRVALVTVRAVEAGEQLLVDYGHAYWHHAGIDAHDLGASAAGDA